MRKNDRAQNDLSIAIMSGLSFTLMLGLKKHLRPAKNTQKKVFAKNKQ
jgi:hypothetical protein